jgi:hypothetical protein
MIGRQACQSDRKRRQSLSRIARRKRALVGDKKRQAGRQADRLLRRRQIDVGAPRFHLESLRGGRAHAVEDRQRPALAR